jgi:hypothetical protein
MAASDGEMRILLREGTLSELQAGLEAGRAPDEDWLVQPAYCIDHAAVFLAELNGAARARPASELQARADALDQEIAGTCPARARRGFRFVSDNFNNRIEEFDAAGSFVAKWGTLGAGPGELSDPAGLAVDSSGAVWVADRGNNRIVRFSLPAATQSTGPGGGEPEPEAGAGVDTSAPRIGLGGRHAQRSRLVARRGLALRVSASERVRITLRAILSRRDARRLGLRGRSAARSSADLAAAGTRGFEAAADSAQPTGAPAGAQSAPRRARDRNRPDRQPLKRLARHHAHTLSGF